MAASELEDEVEFDENISDVVRAYPCLYDKRNRDYKDINVNMNAWASVAEKLGLDDGETAKRLFYNIKKRYNKRRNDLRKAERPGTSAVTLSSAKEKVEEFKFLAWLNPFIQKRSTKTNLLQKRESAEVSKIKNVSSIMGNCDASDRTQEDGIKDIEDNVNGSTVVNGTTASGAPRTSCERKRPTECLMSAVKGRKKWCQGKLSRDEADRRFLPIVNRTIEAPMQDDEDLFGMLVASDLRQLDHFDTIIAKNKIQNLLFELQMQGQNHQDELDRRFLPIVNRAVETPIKDHKDIFGMLVASDLRQLNHFNKRIAKNRIQNMLFEFQMQDRKQLQRRQQSAAVSVANINPRSQSDICL